MKPYVDAWADKGEVDDGIWNTIDEVSGEGKVSVIPFAVDVPYCYYRPSMFAEAGLEVPTTFEEFLNCVKTLTKDTDGDGNTDVYGYGLRGSGGHAIWASFAYARGGGMDNLISEGSIQAMQDVIDLYEGGYIPASSTTDGFNEIIGNFKAGITAMTVHHIGSSNEMMELFGDDVAAFIIPGDKPEYTWAQMGETSNVILSNCEHPEAAFEWIAYLTTGEGQYIWNTAVGKIPVATSLRSDEAFSNPFYQASFDALAHTGVLPMLDTLDQNRQFYRHQAEFKDYSNQNFEWLPELTLTDVQAMLDNIDNQRLLQAIAGLDVMSQKIIFYRIEGYRNPEIASLLGISNSSVETKWWRLRKKLKKFL